LLLIVLAMAQFMVVLDFTIVNVALPFSGFLLLGGRLADLFGRVRLFRIG
jgi:MFS family permease